MVLVFDSDFHLLSAFLQAMPKFVAFDSSFPFEMNYFVRGFLTFLPDFFRFFVCRDSNPRVHEPMAVYVIYFMKLNRRF